MRNFFFFLFLETCRLHVPGTIGEGGGNRQQGPNKAIGFYNDRSIELENAQEDEINVSEYRE